MTLGYSIYEDWGVLEMGMLTLMQLKRIVIWHLIIYLGLANPKRERELSYLSIIQHKNSKIIVTHTLLYIYRWLV